MNARRWPVVGFAVMVAVLSCSCANLMRTEGWPSFAVDELPDEVDAGPPSVKKLACEIDCLEKHIDKYGSIVPKHADVWGQGRLMMHRQEFERVMKPDAYTFAASIQATISTSDQA